MSDNLVRDIHDAVARSENPAEASVRPPGTTRRGLATMRRDVLRKLRVSPGESVIEIGCGVGILGEPLAESAARYVGLDFAPQAVAVANERFRAAGLASRASARCVDVLALEDDQIRALGRFDRLLMYGVLHLARSEDEAIRFLRLTSRLLESGGRALVGNLPLEDLLADWTRGEEGQGTGQISHWMAAARWTARRGVAPVPLTRLWKLRFLTTSVLSRWASGPSFTPAELPPKYTIPLTTGAVERWLEMLPEETQHRWQVPAPGVPLAAGRADLIIARR